VRLIALALLVIGAALASGAYAYQPLTRSGCEEATLVWDQNANVCTGSVEALEPPSGAETTQAAGQPLTRADCDRAGMRWNDNAHVCEEGTPTEATTGTVEALDPPSGPETTQAAGQPLTRIDCDRAGMRWNDNANVCEEGAPTEATTAEVASSVVLINIDKEKQRMTVFVDGVEQYDWPVSTGLRGYSTPSGTYTTSSMNKMWYSKQWDNAPMPHAVFFTKEGHAIHGTYEVKRLGKPASHGCVRLSTENAATLYALVGEIGLKNTQVVLAGLTPGGESRDGQQMSSRRYRDLQLADPDRGPRRGGFFRRLFGRR
jgi:lipoprotein-anchoring transpeptidase ErfK/SrfK